MKKLWLVGLLIGVLIISCDLFREYDTEWKFKAVKTAWNISSPALGHDGTIYFGLETPNDKTDNRLYALYPDGNLKWEYPVETGVISAPAIDSDGTVYFVASGQGLFALNPDGTLKWSCDIGSGCRLNGPVTSPDGKIYCNGGEGKLFAVDSNGLIQWEYPDAIDPVVSFDGAIYAESEKGEGLDRRYYLISLSNDGTMNWEFEISGWIRDAPAIGTDGTIYFGTQYQRERDWGDTLDTMSFYALNPDGSLKWQYKQRGDFTGSPAIGEDGSIYVGVYEVYDWAVEWDSTATFLWALTADGELKWKCKLDWGYFSTPAIGDDGIIYVGQYYGDFYAIDSYGSVLWSVNVGKMVDLNKSSPAIGDDGSIYFGAENILYAIKGSSGGLASSPWPKFQHDNQRTGRAR